MLILVGIQKKNQINRDKGGDIIYLSSPSVNTPLVREYKK